ncbi:protoporphyrin IX magnesium-chelatase [Streptomyces sp. Ag109_O5-1]|uniref:AAA family ATPase n=1 Tax=Streptomyces sp. Ag109_O5-1 TaxID=1938851 RepID=UPI000FAAC0F1|nr:AAA family ATPase [Streptomyces sp. Ag109_O5-1]RPE40775.1 protoporphyrin IX magnesium-chelatase [Streptomyces sp. Ag109_O5-1]
MTRAANGVHILPYARVVGQAELKLALQLNHIVPRIGGVLIAGPRGTAKSTLVRAFALMAHGELPVTLPINATDDRVLGGWDLDALIRGEARPQPGLLEEADGKGLLYVDEVNLLDDHLVNIILDVVSTGVLSVQREGLATAKHLSFGLVGTMNPEEGGLRPQLLDRFGLMVTAGQLDTDARRHMLRTVLDFEQELTKQESDWLAAAEKDDADVRERLTDARRRAPYLHVPDDVLRLCAAAAEQVDAVGQRGEIVAMLAARALAALEGADEVGPGHLRRVLPMALRHRRPETAHGAVFDWGPDDEAQVGELFGTV